GERLLAEDGFARCRRCQQDRDLLSGWKCHTDYIDRRIVDQCSPLRHCARNSQSIGDDPNAVERLTCDRDDVAARVGPEGRHVNGLAKTSSDHPDAEPTLHESASCAGDRGTLPALIEPQVPDVNYMLPAEIERLVYGMRYTDDQHLALPQHVLE